LAQAFDAGKRNVVLNFSYWNQFRIPNPSKIIASAFGFEISSSISSRTLCRSPFSLDPDVTIGRLNVTRDRVHPFQPRPTGNSVRIRSNCSRLASEPSALSKSTFRSRKRGLTTRAPSLLNALRSAAKSTIRNLISRSFPISSSATLNAAAFRRRQLPLLYRTKTMHFARPPDFAARTEQTDA
jgi:hypothetical protein